MKKKFCLSCIIIIALLMTGCWDYKDVEKRLMVIAVGVDRIDKDIQFATEIVSPSDRLEHEIETQLDVARGRNFESARINVNTIRPNPTFLGTTRVVIFGKKYAKEGIKPYIGRINKISDYRKTLLAVVSREPAEKILKVKPKNDISSGFFIEHNVQYLSKNGDGVYTNIGEILSTMASNDVGFILPYVGIENNQIKYLGLAVMKNSKLIDVIDVKESDGLLYMLASKPMLTEDICIEENKKNIYSLNLTGIKKNIKTSYKDGKIIITVDLNLKEMIQYQYYNRPIYSKTIKLLEIKIAEKVKNDISKIVKKTQNEYQSDVFNFAKYFKSQNPEINKKIDWKKEYPKVDVRVNVEAKILNENLADPNAKFTRKK